MLTQFTMEQKQGSDSAKNSTVDTKEQEIEKTLNLKQLPINELHVHAEGGTLTRAMLTKLAQQNNKPIPQQLFYESAEGIKYQKGDFLDFLKAYDQATSYILTEQDITDVIFCYLKRCAEQGANYIEMTCSPDHVKQYRQTDGSTCDISYKKFVDAIAQAIKMAKSQFGIESRILMVMLRHTGVDHCQKTLEEILAYRHPYVVGLNLAGDEERFPLQDFAELFQTAKQNDLCCTAHVGEFAGAEQVKTAIDMACIDRFGHGVRCIESPEVMQQLKEKKIGLEICPGSNIHLGVAKDYASHPIHQLIKFGIKCSISSDDPAFFNTSIQDEYSKVQHAGKYSNNQMLKLCEDGIEMSFAEPSLKQKLSSHLKLYRCLQNLYYNIEDLDKTAKQQLDTYISQPSLAQAQQVACKVKQNAKLTREIHELADLLVAAHQKYISDSLTHDNIINYACVASEDPKRSARTSRKTSRTLKPSHN